MSQEELSAPPADTPQQEEEAKPEPIPTEQIQTHVAIVLDQSASKDDLHKSLTQLGDWLREDVNREPIGQTGVIPRVVSLMGKGEGDDTTLYFLCARILGNLCFDQAENRKRVIQAGGISPLIKIVSRFAKDLEGDCAKASAGALANLASGCVEAQLLILDKEGLEALVQALESSNEGTVQLALRAITNLAEDDKVKQRVSAKALPSLCKILESGADSTKKAAFEAIENIVDQASNADAFAKSGHMKTVLKILVGEDETLAKQASEFLGAMAQSDNTRKVFLDDSLLKELWSLCEHEKLVIRRVAITTLGFISVDDQVAEKLATHLTSVTKFLEAEDIEIKVSTAMLLGNLARTEERCKTVCTKEVVTKLQGMLEEDQDRRLRQYASGVIRNICLPACNKPLLVSFGLIEQILKLITPPTPKENETEVETLQRVNSISAPLVFSLVVGLKNLFVGNKEAVKVFIENNGVKTLKLLQFPEQVDRILLEGARAIVSLCKDPSLHKNVVEEGGLELLIVLLESSWPLLRFEGAQALAQLSTQESLRSQVARCPGIMLALIGVLKGETKPADQFDQLSRTATCEALLNFCSIDDLVKGMKELKIVDHLSSCTCEQATRLSAKLS